LLDATQLKYVRQIEQDYIKRIEDILTPITGAQNIRAQVNANLDFSVSEQTSENFKPNQPPNQASVRSLQSMETKDIAKSLGGVPGALSNQPPVAATAPIVTTASGVPAASGSDTSNSHKEMTTNYEVDRTIQHTKLPTGNLKRLSVAVVLNNRNITDKDGKVISKPYSDEEKTQITSLIKEAVGFEEKRGDTLNLLNSAFNDTQEILPEIPIWKQPDMLALVKDVLKYLLIAGGIGFLLFGIIRPAFKSVAHHATAQNEAAPQDAGLSGEGGHPAGAAGEYAAQQSGNSYDHNLQIAKQLAKDDPKIVATVVKEWVNKDE
jgi:flagellar M-ring protein FliF